MSEQQDVDDVVKALYADWLRKQDPFLQMAVRLDDSLASYVEKAAHDFYVKGVMRPAQLYKICPMCKRVGQP